MIHLEIQKELDAPEGKILLQVNGEFATGNLVTVYGESGAGKTSFLRMLSGLMDPDRGKIIVNDQTWFDSETKINFKPQKRKIGFVFQDYALFPNMTVKQNIEYALDGRAKKSGVEEIIDIFKLGQLMNKFTDKLSGGQKQRVALARAIARKPDLLMLDEPLSALDHQMRINLQDYLLTVHKKYGLTTFLVSHDVGEIFKMSDEVMVLKNGKIDDRGKPFEVFSNRHISGKFQFTGEVIHIEKEDIVYIVTVLIGNHMVKIVSEAETAKSLQPGEKVLVASKAFNPIIQKI